MTQMSLEEGQSLGLTFREFVQIKKRDRLVAAEVAWQTWGFYT